MARSLSSTILIQAESSTEANSTVAYLYAGRYQGNDILPGALLATTTVGELKSPGVCIPGNTVAGSTDAISVYVNGTCRNWFIVDIDTVAAPSPSPSPSPAPSPSPSPTTSPTGPTPSPTISYIYPGEHNLYVPQIVPSTAQLSFTGADKVFGIQNFIAQLSGQSSISAGEYYAVQYSTIKVYRNATGAYVGDIGLSLANSKVRYLSTGSSTFTIYITSAASGTYITGGIANNTVTKYLFN
jgi:hypothetical protein